MRTLVICSGGFDSVTMAHKATVEETPDYGLEARDAYLASPPI